MDYILTGNEGFIGKHLEKKLLKKHNVISVDLKNGKDLNDLKIINQLPDCDKLFHLAATNGTKLFYEKPREILFNNTYPTLNLVKKYYKTNTKFIFASTCEIFNGAIDNDYYEIPTDEDVPVVFYDILNPRWSYSLPKALGENLISNSMNNWLIIRYFNIYGPGQEDHFIQEFVERVKSGKYYINGDDTRSFCYIEDAINLTIEADKNFKNEIVNIGNDSEYKISYVAKLILKLMGISESRLEVRDSPKGSVKRRCPNIKKIINKTNYEFQYTLENGIVKTLEDLL